MNKFSVVLVLAAIYSASYANDEIPLIAKNDMCAMIAKGAAQSYQYSGKRLPINDYCIKAIRDSDTPECNHEGMVEQCRQIAQQYNAINPGK